MLFKTQNSTLWLYEHKNSKEKVVVKTCTTSKDISDEIGVMKLELPHTPKLLLSRVRDEKLHHGYKV